MDTLNGRLLELVQKLEALGPGPSLVNLAKVVESCRLSSADVAPYVHANRQNYNRAPVVIRDDFELLVMTWLPGQASVPHDHTGSICAMQVVEGEAAEACYRVAPDGYVDLEYEALVRSGEMTSGQDAGVHTVRNPSRTGELLVTVHVYAPPLQDFRRFVPRPKPLNDAQQAISDEQPTIVVVGGGFSGSITAAQILRRAGRAGACLRVAVVERRGAIGEGLAYGTREPSHLLNVPASRMSAWPDQPDDFVRWATRRYGNIAPSDFLPRQWYGEYVRETLLAVAREVRDSAELSVVFDEVRRVSRHPTGGWIVHLARGDSLRARAVVLAIGHRPPSDPIGPKWSGPRTRFISDPWRQFAMNPVRSNEPVVILGTGLTAVDAVLSLAELSHQAPITLLSRNGLLPQAHAAAPLAPAQLEGLATELLAAPGGVRALALSRGLRMKVREFVAQGGDWRSVVDGLRPHTAPLWKAMSIAERRRFLSRLRPFWEVHRHRMAQPIARRFHDLLDRRQVQIVAGRVEAVQAEHNRVRLIVRERGTDRMLDLVAAWVINCTGPMPSNRPESNPVIGSLLVDGWLRLDQIALGIETTADGNALDAGAREVPDLFVVGTLRKPELWETTAVPELRAQAATVGERAFEQAFGPSLNRRAVEQETAGKPRAHPQT
jgi:uncharacterized NAD(P)/FAD-binding protein YdhS